MLDYFFRKSTPYRALLLLTILALAACGKGSSESAKANTSLQLKGEVSTFAGAYVGQDGVGILATFNRPSAIVRVDGNLYIADSQSNSIRKMVIATGAVTTFAGKMGARGNVDGKGTAARFAGPAGIASDGSNLYVADTDNRTIRKIEIATGSVSTLAGAVGVTGSANGLGSAARFSEPRGITSDGYNLYVSDSGNNTIRKIVIGTGEVSTLAGSPSSTGGSADGVGSAASFEYPMGLASDGIYLYVCDTGNKAIRKVTIATGAVTTIALHSSSDPTAELQVPQAIILDGGELYLTDLFSIYRVVVNTGELTRQLVISNGSGWGGGTRLFTGLAKVDSSFYLTSFDSTINKLEIASGDMNTVAGEENSSERLASLRDIVSDGTHLYLLNLAGRRIEKINIASGNLTTFVDLPFQLNGNLTLHDAQSLAVDAKYLYVSMTREFSDRIILKIDIATKAISALPSPSANQSMRDAFDAMTTDGVNIYGVDYNRSAIYKVVIASGVETLLAGSEGHTGDADGVGPMANFNRPYGIAMDGTHLYVADSYNHSIRKVNIASRQVTTLAGKSGVLGASDGLGIAARFAEPSSITCDGKNLYIADTQNHSIRKLELSSGEVTTLAGTPGVPGRADGMGSTARFAAPWRISADATSLFVADDGTNSIRRIE
ncbi:MAG TPA: hypothetical protein VN030_07245 [Cellvibrio sp.]|nr:hypothetical protein [Cellvibrio sp.]